ncbi:MAG: ROK family glucokinase, partial [Candidatus Hydrogenedentes bacterium]|nr:ROK family glucokinase [Candidatus Hydrogenedentota bacterium]
RWGRRVVSEAVIGVDLGGTNVKAAVCSRDGKLIAKDSRPTDAENGRDAVLSRIEESIDAALAEAGFTRSDMLAVGMGVPGPMNWQTGVLFSPPNLPGWKDVPVADLMHERLGVPVFVDNDANVAAFGEFWGGAGRGVQSMVLLTLGTGVGGGIVVFGRLLRGIDGTAAEIGHLCVKRNGRQCNCGAKGCLEAYASVTGMLRTAVKGIEDGHETLLTTLCGGDLSKLTGKMISDAVAQGDGFAEWVMEQTGVWLGTGIGSLINLLNPEKVVLTGGMIAAGEVLFRPIRETALAQSFDVPGRRAEIVAAGLGADSGVIGAAGCALERLQTGGAPQAS